MQVKEDPLPVTRQQPLPSDDGPRRPPCFCLNCHDSYPYIFQAIDYVDTIDHVLPCDEYDRVKLSKYQFEFHYDEEHLFRCWGKNVRSDLLDMSPWTKLMQYLRPTQYWWVNWRHLLFPDSRKGSFLENIETPLKTQESKHSESSN